ncbi:hypothetical protein BDV96DRAFT_630773 [Lophiotrema nucula]|uniref:Uncharacterized protein n=1 Tax=Lophiotrema nucula TaxID=690887 RepID=A0A6A5ZF57_9PLEO|nr:hypothetical protein BDV96DRAFT_630773 [Lophiotrema nucula]
MASREATPQDIPTAEEEGACLERFLSSVIEHGRLVKRIPALAAELKAIRAKYYTYICHQDTLSLAHRLELQERREPLKKAEEFFRNALNKSQSQEEQLLRRCQDQVHEYAQVSCLLLCHRMQTKLPRELRDQILGKLYCGFQHFKRFDHTALPWNRAFEYTAIKPRGNEFAGSVINRRVNEVAHYWNLEFVGLETLRDLAQAWYEDTEFIFLEPVGFQDFLSPENVTGLHPAELVRSMRIMMEASNLNNMDTFGRKITSTRYQETLDGLRSLLTLRNASIQIEYSTSCASRSPIWDGGYATFNLFLKFFQGVMDVLVELQKVDLRVNVTLDKVDLRNLEISAEAWREKFLKDAEVRQRM